MVRRRHLRRRAMGIKPPVEWSSVQQLPVGEKRARKKRVNARPSTCVIHGGHRMIGLHQRRRCGRAVPAHSGPPLRPVTTSSPPHTAPSILQRGAHVAVGRRRDPLEREVLQPAKQPQRRSDRSRRLGCDRDRVSSDGSAASGCCCHPASMPYPPRTGRRTTARRRGQVHRHRQSGCAARLR